MSDECVAVFTARSPHRILREGGSQAWVLDPDRARKCRYLICVQNQHNPDRDFSDASEAHGAAFMVGKINDVIPAPEDPSGGRWMICISEYSIHTLMNAWKGWRNPVRYTSLEEMGINPDDLNFHSVADEQRNLGVTTNQQALKKQDDRSVVSLSIASAKAGLAAYYGVSQEAIEIIIRG
ncbi:MAG TPA: hypothetical protein VL485_16065 [Ktedonobacteraceae bacterium]|jgi:hypothetical protein|nr:hypothetical protein [Ktedonobacteraceae bacterium]